jgi:PAS domain S-box-containing protein
MTDAGETTSQHTLTGAPVPGATGDGRGGQQHAKGPNGHAAGSAATVPQEPVSSTPAEVPSRDVTTERIAGGMFVVVVVVLTLATIVTFRSLHSVIEAGHWVEHTLEVEKELAALSLSVEVAETAYLEFIITGDDGRLSRIQAAQADSTRRLQQIAFLTQDNANQQRRIAALIQAAKEDFTFRADAVTRRQLQGWEAARALIATDRGTSSLQTVRSLINEMTNEEERLLRSRTALAAGDIHQATLLRGALGAVALLAITGAFFLVRRNLRLRQSALDAIQSRKRSLTETAKVVADLRVVQASETLFRGLLEAAPDANVIVGEDGKIVHLNSRTERLFGYSPGELLGHDVEELMPERLRKHEPARQGGYFSVPGIRPEANGIELCGRRKDGTEFPIELSLGPVDTEAGRLVSGAIRDITERKVAETALKLSNEELGAFSYSVAHDLRAPLRGMNGFAQVLLDTYREVLDVQGQDWLLEVLLNAKKMSDLIDALLSLARYSRGELKVEPVDLSAMGREVGDRLQAGEHLRQVRIDVQEKMHANMDPRLARVVYENLVGNAWKFTSNVPEAHIELGQTESRGAHAFFVRDNGAGFDMAFGKQLFVAFHRLHTVAEFPGTGIGLATVQRIVQRHGGQIWAEGHVGAGATFFFTVPSQGVSSEARS